MEVWMPMNAPVALVTHERAWVFLFVLFCLVFNWSNKKPPSPRPQFEGSFCGLRTLSLMASLASFGGRHHTLTSKNRTVENYEESTQAYLKVPVNSLMNHKTLTASRWSRRGPRGSIPVYVLNHSYPEFYGGWLGLSNYELFFYYIRLGPYCLITCKEGGGNSLGEWGHTGYKLPCHTVTPSLAAFSTQERKLLFLLQAH